MTVLWQFKAIALLDLYISITNLSKMLKIKHLF